MFIYCINNFCDFYALEIVGSFVAFDKVFRFYDEAFYACTEGAFTVLEGIVTKDQHLTRCEVWAA